MKYALIALALVLASATARADQQPTPTSSAQVLFNMANDRDRNVDVYGLVLSGDAPVSFMTAQNNDVDHATNFSLSDVASPNGVVLLEGQGHKVMFLQGQLDRSGQGRFHLRFLNNGMTNQYVTCDFLVQRSGNSYFAQNAYTGARITSAKIVTWALGLKTIQGICQ